MSTIYTDPPQSRNEAIIKSTIDGTQYTDPPQSRMEDLLLDLKEAIEGGGGGGTTVVANPEGEATDDLEKLQVGNDIYGIPKDYEEMSNKPSINSVELSGNKTASELGLQAELDGAQTVEGNPITVTDAESMNAESVVVELEPKQDLHGYDTPWVGGSGKNKLPLVLSDIKAINTEGTWSGNTYTRGGVSYEVITDNGGDITGVKATGTATSGSAFVFPNLGFSGEAILTGCPSGGTASTYMQVTGENPVVYEYGNGVSFTSTLNTFVYLFIANGYTIPSGGLMFYPMIRLSTETDPTFAPYSNICPITGYSEVNVERDGDTYTVSLGGTKYGGTLDVTEGRYSDEWGTHTLDYVTLEDGLFTASAPNNVKGDVFAQAKCNRMKTWASVDDLDDNYGIAYSNNTFYMKLPPECGTTASEVDDWLGENPISIAYLKKTPSSVSTTPTDIPLLENTNNISTNGTNIELKYQPNNVIGECKAYTDEKCSEVLPPLPTTDGTYHLSCEVTSGVGVLSWVSDS